MCVPRLSAALLAAFILLASIAGQARAGKGTEKHQKPAQQSSVSLDVKSLPLVTFPSYPPVTVGEFLEYYGNNTPQEVLKKGRGEILADVRVKLDAYVKGYLLKRYASGAIRDDDPRLPSLVYWIERKPLNNQIKEYLSGKLKEQFPPELLVPAEKYRKYILNMLVMDNVAALEEVRGKVLAGADYESYSDSPQNIVRARRKFAYQVGGGYFAEAEEDAIFRLGPGGISEILLLPAGSGIVKVEEIREADPREIAERRQVQIGKFMEERGRDFNRALMQNIPVDRIGKDEFVRLVLEYYNGDYVEDRQVAAVGDLKVFFFELVDSTRGLYVRIRNDREFFISSLEETLDRTITEMSGVQMARMFGLDLAPQQRAEATVIAKVGLFMLDELKKDYEATPAEDVDKTFGRMRDDFIRPLRLRVYRATFADRETAKALGEIYQRDSFSPSAIVPYRGKVRGKAKNMAEIRPSEPENAYVFEEMRARGITSAQRYFVMEWKDGFELVYIDQIYPADRLSPDDVRGFVKRVHYEVNKPAYFELVKGRIAEKEGPKIDVALLEKVSGMLAAESPKEQKKPATPDKKKKPADPKKPKEK